MEPTVNPTFASFITPEGIIVAGALITALVQLIKTVAPAVDAKVPGAVMAFAGATVLYLATGAVIGVPTPDAALTLAASWLACATASVGTYSTIRAARSS